MTPTLYIDFETRSTVDLRRHGLARYARDPSTEALMLGWVFDDEPQPMLWNTGTALDARLNEHVRSGGLVVAHNAQFELAIWNFVMAKRHGWPALSIEQVRCTMASCYAQALPGALENAAHALGLKTSKDAEGRALMLKMCKPRADGSYFETPEAMARLGEYCKTDVTVEREIYKRVLPLTDKEQRLWQLDQRINLRGIPFDMPSLVAALVVADKEKVRLNHEMGKVTNGAVQACSNIGALKEWAADFGVMPDSLAKAELNELLDEELLPADVRAALKLRQAAGRFTSISKLDAIERRHVGGRVPFTFQYHAATTGRWAGRGIQPHNFTRDLPAPADVENVLRLLREGNTPLLDMTYGEPSIMISKCLRGFIHAAPGKVFLGGDFSNVEGRGIAWLAGEEWKLDAFRDYDAGTGPDLYNVAYSKSFGVPVGEVTKGQRQIGKAQELAFGYQGGVGAFATMGKVYGVKVPDWQADEFKNAWRAAHPKIKQYWRDLQVGAIGAVTAPGIIVTVGAAGREVMFRKRGSFLWCRLPSGRTLCYPYPDVREGNFGSFLTFKGVPDAMVWSIYQEQKLRGEPNTTYIVEESTNAREWCRMSTYGGKVAENVTSAVCRDLLGDAMLRIDQAGYPVCLHMHDEVLAEGVFTEQNRATFAALMIEGSDWAKDFPIAAACWLSARYIKG